MESNKKAKTYKAVSTKTVLLYARENGLALKFEDFLTQWYSNLKLDFHELNPVDISGIFPKHLMASEEVERINSLDLDQNYIYSNTECPISKPIAKIQQIDSTKEYELSDVYESDLIPAIFSDLNTGIEDFKLEENTFPTDPDQFDITWVDDFLNTQNPLNEEEMPPDLNPKACPEDSLTKLNYESPQNLNLEFPVLPADSKLNSTEFFKPFFINDTPTLADSDFSDEMNSIELKSKTEILSKIDVDRILNDSKPITENPYDNLQLDYPIYTQPKNDTYLDVMDLSPVDSGNSPNLNNLNFVDENFFEESIDQLSLFKLPLPLFDLITKPPVLPEFELPMWNFSYTVICSMNWTPFGKLTEITEETFENEYKIFELKLSEIEARYDFTSPKNPITRPIGCIDNKADVIMLPYASCSNLQVIAVSTPVPGQDYEKLPTSSIIEKVQQKEFNSKIIIEDLNDNDSFFSSDNNEQLSDDNSHILSVNEISPHQFSKFAQVFEHTSTSKNSDSIQSKRKHVNDMFEDDSVWNDIVNSVDKNSFIENNVVHPGNFSKSTGKKSKIQKISHKAHTNFPQNNMLEFSPFFANIGTSVDKHSSQQTTNDEDETELFCNKENFGQFESLLKSTGSTQEKLKENKFITSVWSSPVVNSSSNSVSKVVVNTGLAPLAVIKQFKNSQTGIQIIEADLGNNSDSAHFYMSHKACIILLSLVGLGQRSLTGGLKALAKIHAVKETTELVFVVVTIEEGQKVTQQEMDALNIFQVCISILPWAQSFIIPAAALVNFIGHLASIHGIDLPLDLFETIPIRSMQFMKLCGINGVAAASILKDVSILDLIQFSPAYLAIKYGDLMTVEQMEFLQNVFSSDWHV